MGLRKGHCYTRVKRAYTRKSKFKKHGFIKAVPKSKIVRYDMGDLTKQFNRKLELVTKDEIQLRHNSLESARIVVNRQLHEMFGMNYFFKVLVFPHQVLRENKVLTGAGADRMQTGMQQAFGKAVGIAARVRKGQSIFSIKVNEENVDKAKSALKKAGPRMPGKFSIVISKI